MSSSNKQAKNGNYFDERYDHNHSSRYNYQRSPTNDLHRRSPSHDRYRSLKSEKTLPNKYYNSNNYSNNRESYYNENNNKSSLKENESFSNNFGHNGYGSSKIYYKPLTEGNYPNKRNGKRQRSIDNRMGTVVRANDDASSRQNWESELNGPVTKKMRLARFNDTKNVNSEFSMETSCLKEEANMTTDVKGSVNESIIYRKGNWYDKPKEIKPLLAMTKISPQNNNANLLANLSSAIVTPINTFFALAANCPLAHVSVSPPPNTVNKSIYVQKVLVDYPTNFPQGYFRANRLGRKNQIVFNDAHFTNIGNTDAYIKQIKEFCLKDNYYTQLQGFTDLLTPTEIEVNSKMTITAVLHDKIEKLNQQTWQIVRLDSPKKLRYNCLSTHNEFDPRTSR